MRTEAPADPETRVADCQSPSCPSTADDDQIASQSMGNNPGHEKDEAALRKQSGAVSVQ
jgi:hypothetical protein